MSTFPIPSDVGPPESDEGFRGSHDLDEAVVQFELHGEVFKVSSDAGSGGEVEKIVCSGNFEVYHSE